MVIDGRSRFNVLATSEVALMELDSQKKDINLMVGDNGEFRNRGKILNIFSSIDFIPHYVYDNISDITTLSNPMDVATRLLKVNREDLIDFIAINRYLKSILFMNTLDTGGVETLNNQVLIRSKSRGSTNSDDFRTPVANFRDNLRKFDKFYDGASTADYYKFYSTEWMLAPIGSLLEYAMRNLMYNKNLGELPEGLLDFYYNLENYTSGYKLSPERGSRVLNSLLPKDGNLINFRNTFDIKFYNLNFHTYGDYIIKKGAIVVLRDGFGSYLRSSREEESIIEMYKAIYVSALNNFDIKSVINSPFFTIMTKINSVKAIGNTRAFTH